MEIIKKCNWNLPSQFRKSLTDVFFLEFSSQMALHKCCFTSTTITDKDKLRRLILVVKLEDFCDLKQMIKHTLNVATGWTLSDISPFIFLHKKYFQKYNLKVLL